VWALPGGRIYVGEDLTEAVQRILSPHNITASDFFLVGVFPVAFPSRFDVSICVAARHFSGAPVPDGIEFTKVRWFKALPKRTGTNYRRMIEKWRQAKGLMQVVKFNRV
jgi:ADP-ribose pyrophosphatase YjhB (NUDIX family)